jgi:molecular chaperone DnaK (HSP70)
MSSLVKLISPYVFGIDLGTSYSEIAIYRKGASQILPVEGSEKTASVISVVKSGDIIVGRAARSRLMLDPENTVSSVKRQMGSDWKKTFDALPEKTFTPADISAEILSKLVSGVQTGGVDLRGTPLYAVICIPANFTDAQRKETKEAGETAGLAVLWLLEEPIAAALAYACDQNRDQTILVYDLGGGTFDVAILKVKSSTEDQAADFEFLAKEGVPRLGGDDFDNEIMKIAADSFKASSGIDIMDLSTPQGITQRALLEAQQKLKDAAERAKVDLTDAQSVDISIPALVSDEQGNLHNLEVQITRDKFEEAIRPLLDQSKDAVVRALESAKLGMADISRIILVGGSTQVPLVKRMLYEMFDKEPYSDLNPDTVVARGAAIFGAQLELPTDKLAQTSEVHPEDQLQAKITIHQIVTHHLGIEIVGGKFSPVLVKGMEIPADQPITNMKEYANTRDNMTELRITVFQSDHETDVVGGPGVECIGELFIPIAPKPKNQERVKVSFEIDQQNLLKVRVKSSIRDAEMEIKRV